MVSSLLLLLITSVLIMQTSSWTVEVPARNRFCVYEEITDSGFKDDTVPANDSMVFYYQVLSGGEANKISFDFRRYDRANSKVHNFGSQAQKERAYAKVAYMDGLYEMCLNNDDLMTTKVVAWHLTPPLSQVSIEVHNKTASDIALLEIANAMTANMRNLTQSVRMDRYKNFQALKSSILLNSRVNFWSQFVMAGTFLTGICQVVAVRRLFNQPQTGSRKLLNSAT